MATIEDLVRKLGDGGTLFAAFPFTPESEAALFMGEVDEVEGVVPGYEYVLECDVALEVLAVWSHWRDGRTPTSREAAEAVIYYGVNDAYLPLEAGD